MSDKCPKCGEYNSASTALGVGFGCGTRGRIAGGDVLVTHQSDTCRARELEHQVDRLAAENAKLREAVEAIDGCCDELHVDIDENFNRDDISNSVAKIQHIAQAALRKDG